MLTNYFRDLLQQRRGQPGADLISILLAAEEDGETLLPEAIYAQCIFFLFAGHETTTNLIANGINCLVRFPEQQHLLRTQCTLLPRFIEEVLRYDGPMQYTFRQAKTDMELFLQPVKQGDVFVFLFGAANRDHTIFFEPDCFDITRARKPQLTFGYGLHHCIGAITVWMEAEIAFNAILDRIDAMCLIELPQYNTILPFASVDWKRYLSNLQRSREVRED